MARIWFQLCRLFCMSHPSLLPRFPIFLYTTLKVKNAPKSNPLKKLNMEAFRLAQVMVLTKSCRKIWLTLYPLYLLPPFVCLLLIHLHWNGNHVLFCIWVLLICIHVYVLYILPEIVWALLTVHTTQYWEYVWVCSSSVHLSAVHIYISAVAQSFVSVAEAGTSQYGPWHCQHEAPPLIPPQKIWLLTGSFHHWTSVLWFDTIVQILPFCPLSPRFLSLSDRFPFLSSFFSLSLTDGGMNLKITQ